MTVLPSIPMQHIVNEPFSQLLGPSRLEDRLVHIGENLHLSL